MAKRKFLDKLVLVTWEDAELYLSPGWLSLHEVDTSPALVHTVGWVIHETDRRLMIAQSVGVAGEPSQRDGDVNGVMKIPMGMVRNVKLLTA